MKYKLSKTIFIALLFIGEAANDIFAQKLYSTSPSGSTLFSFNTDDNTIATIGKFSSVNLAMPIGTLVHTGNGVFYGVTNNSANLYGAIYKADTSSGTISIIYQFTNINKSVSGFVLAGNGKLYTLGITGTSNNNAIYVFDPSNNTYTQAYEIPGNSGTPPLAGLIKAKNGLLYGVTQRGGANSLGRLFSFDPANNTFTNLHDFNTSGGTQPLGALTQASNGKLYGVAAYGGANDKGVIFSFDPGSNVYTKLFDFVQATGENPGSQLIQAKNGLLYGTTMSGGDNYQGVIYSFDLTSNTYSKLHAFFAGGGYGPRHKLTQAPNGYLYGTANQGGTNFRGCIFRYDISNNNYTKLVDGNDTSSGNFVSPFFSFEDGTTDIKTVAVNKQVNIYPNPSSDILSLETETDWTNYRLIDRLGQIISEGLLTGNKLDVKNLNNGLYTLILISEGTGMVSKAFLKN